MYFLFCGDPPTFSEFPDALHRFLNAVTLFILHNGFRIIPAQPVLSIVYFSVKYAKGHILPE